MSDDAALVREQVRSALHLHPRVAYQGLYTDDKARAELAARLPDLLAFGDHEYHVALAIIDWDHRLPSKSLLLRLYLYYDAVGATHGRDTFDQRTEEIAQRDRYPEFDVPDYEGLYADEAYEVPLDLAGPADRPRLVSGWRREVAVEVAETCVAVVRGSREFKSVVKAGGRPSGLGDLEAVSWSPPCENDYPTWTVDVWYLTEFDGLLGKGYSFVVDPGQQKLVAAREFVVRAAGGGG